MLQPPRPHPPRPQLHRPQSSGPLLPRTWLPRLRLPRPRRPQRRSVQPQLLRPRQGPMPRTVVRSSRRSPTLGITTTTPQTRRLGRPQQAQTLAATIPSSAVPALQMQALHCCCCAQGWWRVLSCDLHEMLRDVDRWSSLQANSPTPGLHLGCPARRCTTASQQDVCLGGGQKLQRAVLHSGRNSVCRPRCRSRVSLLRIRVCGKVFGSATYHRAAKVQSVGC
mmetsp:Transcript_63777/g.160793  ORF Transcript_63777/g.160793 Transcript_63777/m.160793 type:complete len:223 (+) Transcript_63777:1288-1956(+)